MTANAYKAAADLDQRFLDKMKTKVSINTVDPAPFQERAETVYQVYIKQ